MGALMGAWRAATATEICRPIIACRLYLAHMITEEALCWGLSRGYLGVSGPNYADHLREKECLETQPMRCCGSCQSTNFDSQEPEMAQGKLSPPRCVALSSANHLGNCRGFAVAVAFEIRGSLLDLARSERR